MDDPPHERALDSTSALLGAPYEFIRQRCERHGRDVFAARLIGRDTLCLSGKQAAALFYDNERFERHGAAPEPLRATLFGKGGVQGLDGRTHQVRKALFMSLMTPASIGQLVGNVRNEVDGALRRWSSRPRERSAPADSQSFRLYEALQPILLRAACSWAGVPLRSREVASRTQDVVLLFDAAGRIGLDHLRARVARMRLERWLAALVEHNRAAGGSAIQTPLQAVAWHRDADGALMSPRVAAVELLNLIRPTVAVSVYVVFAAHALHVHPHCRERIEHGDDGDVERFVHEVRRWYPFFPATVARVRRDFVWQGVHFRRGQRVLLDLYGTNHDLRCWQDPELFDPERFRVWDGSPFNFIPQGGGDHRTGHRCPGEWIKIALMQLAVQILVHRVRYTVPPQDLWIDKQRLPALPRSHFLMTDVQPR
jgi:fatty-acid peroxygenase